MATTTKPRSRTAHNALRLGALIAVAGALSAVCGTAGASAATPATGRALDPACTSTTGDNAPSKNGKTAPLLTTIGACAHSTDTGWGDGNTPNESWTVPDNARYNTVLLSTWGSGSLYRVQHLDGSVLPAQTNGPGFPVWYTIRAGGADQAIPVLPGDIIEQAQASWRDTFHLRVDALDTSSDTQAMDTRSDRPVRTVDVTSPCDDVVGPCQAPAPSVGATAGVHGNRGRATQAHANSWQVPADATYNMITMNTWGSGSTWRVQSADGTIGPWHDLYSGNTDEYVPVQPGDIVQQKQPVWFSTYHLKVTGLDRCQIVNNTEHCHGVG